MTHTLEFLLLIPFEDSRANNHNRKARANVASARSIQSFIVVRLKAVFCQRGNRLHKRLQTLPRSNVVVRRVFVLSPTRKIMYIEIFLYLSRKRPAYIYIIIFYITIIGADDVAKISIRWLFTNAILLYFFDQRAIKIEKKNHQSYFSGISQWSEIKSRSGKKWISN